MEPTYTSEAFHLTPHTCVDVKANREHVLLGHVGDVLTINTALTPEQAIEIAEALTEGAAHCLAARGEA